LTASPGPVAILLGTRPEAIKLAPVILELRRRRVAHEVIATGQHRDLVAGILALFGIAADADLGIMRPGQTLDYVLASALTGVGTYLASAAPAAVLVQGDTSSALGAALAAFHHRVPVGHVEAGLRSGDSSLPFPEEMNRRAISVVARWHFAPTTGAADNLRREGIEDRVIVTGNTIVDAVRQVAELDVQLPEDIAELIAAGPYILATAHRRESWGAGISDVAAGLKRAIDEVPSVGLVFATHPNPAARDPVVAALGSHPRARVVDSLDYPVFVRLLRDCVVAVSDSGGVQEEGPTLGVPVLVTRELTERPEGVRAGAVRIIGTNLDDVSREVLQLLRDDGARAAMSQAGQSIYGDGAAAARITDVLCRDLGLCGRSPSDGAGA